MTEARPSRPAPELLRKRVKAADQQVPRCLEILLRALLDLVLGQEHRPAPARGRHRQEQTGARVAASRHGRSAGQNVLAAADPGQRRPPGTGRAARGVADHPLEHRVKAGPVVHAARIAPPDPLIHADPRERRLPRSRQRPGSLQDQPASSQFRPRPQPAPARQHHHPDRTPPAAQSRQHP
jgi:hypothetical protein